MVNKVSTNIVKENITLFLVLILELVVIICLTIALLITCRLEVPANDVYVGTTTVERKSCSSREYKAFNDRVFYYADSAGNVDESILPIFSDSLTTNYPDPDIKVLITNTPMGLDDETIIRGYQITDGVVLEDTFFAITVKGVDYLDEFPLLTNPGWLKLDGLMEKSEAEDIAYSAIEMKVRQDNAEIKGTCSYELFFTNRGNGVIGKPASSFYYEFDFSEKNSFPKGYVYMDGKTGEILESFIDSGIRT